MVVVPVDRAHPLDRDRVVRMALTVLDEVGLENLTLYRIAQRLNVKAPALYWHFKNKKELLDAMGTTVLMDSLLPESDSWAARYVGPDGWREFIRSYAADLRATLLKYRDGAKMVPGTLLTDTRMYAIQETMVTVFKSAGFTAEAAAVTMQIVYNFTVGFAIEEQARHPRPDTPDPNYTPENRLRRIDSGIAPAVARLAAADHPGAADESFTAGLTVIISGLESLRSS